MDNKGDYYNPSDDSFLLAELVRNYAGENALEIAAGTGYISRQLRKNFHYVVSTDIDADALGEADKSSPLVCCDSASAIANMMFDLIVINPPYLPSDKIDDITVDGGKDGIEVTLKMIGDADRLIKKNGTILLITSSLANYKALLRHMNELGYETDVVGKRSFVYEELLAISARRGT